MAEGFPDEQNGDVSFQIITENARMCENADDVIRRRALETKILQSAQFHVQSYVRYVSNSLVTEESTGGGIAQSQLNLH